MSRVMLRTKADVIFEQGEEKGREEGQNDVFDLINFLIRHGRNDDVLKVTTNRQVMKDQGCCKVLESECIQARRSADIDK